jgi:beta-N-acetylhexosaminidase
MERPLELPILISPEGRVWAQNQLDAMTLNQKIGQLLHVAAWSNRGEDHEQEILSLITKYHIGGLIFFQGTPIRQAELTNRFQHFSNTPLMISIDGEWGLAMRLNGVEAFPYQMTLGAVQNVAFIEEMAGAIARQMKRIGVTLNHAPVIDVNTNPANPVINFRSFGESKEEVTARGLAYMNGLQKEGVLACGKHFPGHGDTATDSHFELPVLNKSKDELLKTELYPFQQMMDQGLGAVMVAHLNIPQLEEDPLRASTLSYAIVNDLLKEEMGFGGLVITDALDMGAVATHYAPGLVDLEALLAGNDILLFVKDVPLAVAEIKKAIVDHRISEKEIDKRCLKQLMFKYWMGLNEFKPVSTQYIEEDLNWEANFINDRLFGEAITLIHGEAKLAPVHQNQKTHLVSLFAHGDQADEGALSHHTLLKEAIGNGDEMTLFENLMAEKIKSEVETHLVKFDDFSWRMESVVKSMGADDQIILAIHDIKLKARDNFGITQSIIDFVNRMLGNKNVHLVFFGNPYALAKLPNLKRAKSILITYQENKYTHSHAADALLVKLIPKGKLPVSISKDWPAGHGL